MLNVNAQNTFFRDVFPEAFLDRSEYTYGAFRSLAVQVTESACSLVEQRLKLHSRRQLNRGSVEGETSGNRGERTDFRPPGGLISIFFSTFP